MTGVLLQRKTSNRDSHVPEGTVQRKDSTIDLPIEKYQHCQMTMQAMRAWIMFLPVSPERADIVDISDSQLLELEAIHLFCVSHCACVLNHSSHWTLTVSSSTPHSKDTEAQKSYRRCPVSQGCHKAVLESIVKLTSELMPMITAFLSQAWENPISDPRNG